MEQQHLDQFSPKKKWYVYFIDFIMLFVAVSLGFLAENVRDQQTDKNREISYLKNVHEDLLVDLNKFEYVISSNNFRLLRLDSLHMEINKVSPDLPSLYYYIRNLALRTTFESSHLGLDQIKASGGFRLIQNAKIIAGIQDYERTLNNAMKVEEGRERTLEQARFKMAVVFDAGTLYQMIKNQNMGEGKSTDVRFKRPLLEKILEEKLFYYGEYKKKLAQIQPGVNEAAERKTCDHFMKKFKRAIQAIVPNTDFDQL